MTLSIVVFPEFAEIRQPAYTRRQLRYQGRAPEVDNVSRIDRCWSIVPTPVLLSRQFAWSARGTVYDKDMPSDHIALSMRWAPVRRVRKQSVPQWVADHPAYAEIMADIAREVELDMIDDPFVQLVVAADVLQ